MSSSAQVQHYSRKHRVIAWISRHLFDWPVYTVRQGLLAGMKRKGGLGWMGMAPPETEESRFWAAQSFRGKTVYDIGAFHGLLTLYFAQQAKHVHAYEPNEANRKRLQQNLDLNGLRNVTVRPVGLSDQPGTARMQHDDLMPGGSRIVKDAPGPVITLQTLDLEIEAGAPPPDFIKIDVEGLEIPVLRGALETLARLQPELFVEIHGDTEAEKEENARGVIQLLRQAGYPRILHLESRQDATPTNAKRGHIHALPASS
jgi:FkbM family methyltransferase